MNAHLLGFFLIFACGLAATIFKDLSWGVALYELVYFIFPANRWWYTVPRLRYSYIIGLVLLVTYAIRKRGTGITLYAQSKLLIAMVIIMGIISLWAVWPQEHSRLMLMQLKQLVFVTIAYQSMDRGERFDRVLWAYLGGCFYVSYLAYGTPRNEFGRVEGIGMPDGPNANTVAAVLATSVPLLIGELLISGYRKKAAAILFLVFVLNGLVLFNSRGAFLALAVSTGYFFLTMASRKKISKRKRLALIACVVVCLGAFFYLADPTFWARMGTLEEIRPGEGGATRVNFWVEAISLAYQHPLGLGARAFEFLSPKILPSGWLNPETGTIAVHSTYFEAIVDFGYVGIILILGFIGYTFRDTWDTKKRAILHKDEKLYIRALCLESAFLSYLIAIAFINRLYSEVFYWLMLFASALRRISSSSYSDVSQSASSRSTGAE